MLEPLTNPPGQSKEQYNDTVQIKALTHNIHNKHDISIYKVKEHLLLFLN